MTLTSFQYFNSSAFLSRKRVQNYCFTAYTPNILNTFLLKICIFLLNSLIFKRCRTTSNGREVCLFDTSIPYYLSRERKGGVLSPSQRGDTLNTIKKESPGADGIPPRLAHLHLPPSRTDFRVFGRTPPTFFKTPRRFLKTPQHFS